LVGTGAVNPAGETLEGNCSKEKAHMSKEFLHILLTAKLAVGALSLGVASSATASPLRPGEKAVVAAYEIPDAHAPAAPEFGDRGDGQGGGAVDC
jgi:hypothetical protein